MHDLTHASFFSGVGGLDLGLERAGWRTVSFSEIDPYASAVLAERWPGVPNLGDIVQFDRRELEADTGGNDRAATGGEWAGDTLTSSGAATATLWSGGFPCQDLSVAGKRAGFGNYSRSQSAPEVPRSAWHSVSDEYRGHDGGTSESATYATRSGLAFAFLDLVERHRPPAILLENVPGLLSSHGGKDLGALLGRLGELGYWWAYRILDARHFGVPQRRRRVFIVGLHAGTGLGADSAAAVLSVGTRCDRHPATGHATGEGTADTARIGLDIAGGLTRRYGKGVNTTADDGGIVIDGAPPDPGGVRAADGLARRMDYLAPTLRVGPQKPQDGGPGDTVPIVYTKRARVSAPGTPESWREGGVMPTLNSFDVGDTRTTGIILGDGPQDDPLLPLGLDSHRYRCCGNGVVSDVSEWIGLRLAEALSGG